MKAVTTLFLMMVLAVLGSTTMLAGEMTRVTKVLDGSTIIVANGDTVALLGVGPRQTVNADDDDARDFLEITLGGAEVELVSDGQDAKSGRKLRYVMLDGKLINLMIINEGYAAASLKQDHSRQSEFVQAEKAARISYAGAWGTDQAIDRLERPALASGR